MSVIPVTSQNYATLTDSDGLVIIDCWASWCRPCMMFKPIFEAASKKHTDVTFASLDTEAEPALFGSLGFQAIPTIMAFKDGKRLFAEAGALPAAEFERLIDHLKKIEVVRRPKTA